MSYLWVCLLHIKIFHIIEHHEQSIACNRLVDLSQMPRCNEAVIMIRDRLQLLSIFTLRRGSGEEKRREGKRIFRLHEMSFR
jgi:hypothetical protein